MINDKGFRTIPHYQKQYLQELLETINMTY